MKIRACFLLALAALTTSVLNAQSFSLGMRAGLTKTSIATPDNLSALDGHLRSYTGADLGLTANVPLTGKWSLQPELAYVHKGFRVGEGINIPLFGFNIPVGASVVTKLRYVEMPVLLKYTFGEGRVKGYVAGGPTGAYLLNGSLQTRATVLIDIKLKDVNIPLESIGGQRWELGGQLGAGIQFETGSKILFLDARYSRGFTDINKLPLVDLDIRNTRFGINAGILIPFGNASPYRMRA